MIGIIHYIMINSRSLLCSLFGLPSVFLLMGMASGFRYSFRTSVIIGTIMWCVRYFGLTLFVSTYLGSKYAEEIWFGRLMIILTVLNTLLGVAGIALLFEGSLRKNLLLMIALEIVLTMFYVSAFTLISGDMKNGLSLMGTAKPSDILIVPCFFVFYFLAKRFAGSWVKRYRNWKPGNTLLIDLVLMAYFLIGIQNNTSFATSRGDPGLLVQTVGCIMITGYLWVGLFYKEQKKAEMVRQKLLRYEHALKVHSQQVIEQSLKMNRYHSGIKKSMEALSDRVLQMETGKPEPGTDEEKNSFEAGNRSEMKNLARTYMEGLEQHYREITISKYSDDVSLNEILVACEKRFVARNIPVQIHFHHFRRPDNLSEDDLEQVLNWIADQVITQYTDTGDTYTVLQGGMIKRELVIACQYPGCIPSGADQRKLRRMLKPMHADMYLNSEDGQVNLTIGIPTDA